MRILLPLSAMWTVEHGENPDNAEDAHQNAGQRQAEEPRAVWDCPFNHNDALEFDPLMLKLLTEDSLARIRLSHGSGEAWLATRHRDVRVVTVDRRFSRAAGIGQDLPRMTAEPIAHPDAINLMDPPAHTRLRRAIARGFTSTAVDRLRPRTQQFVDQLFDNMTAAGAPADLVEHLSGPLPLMVTSAMLGIPEQDQEWIAERTRTIMSVSISQDTAAQAKSDFRQYFVDLVARKRREPGDDQLSAMIEPDGASRPLTDDELAMLAGVLAISAHDTLTYEISNIVYLLLTRRDILAQLQEHPELIPNATEELLRFIPFRQGVGIVRVATEDVELSGTTIKAGEAVHVSYLTANRDDEVFPNPHEIDVHRESLPHMTFGYGTHRCPGAQMARMELYVAIETLLRRFPQPRLAVDPSEIEWNAASIRRYPLTLPVEW
jgi:cytochrome P450